MATKSAEKTTHRAKVTGRHAVTLPAKLCRALGIENGDTVEFALDGDHAVLRKAITVDANDLRGILKPYFRDWDDAVAFLEGERSSWERPNEPDSEP